MLIGVGMGKDVADNDVGIRLLFHGLSAGPMGICLYPWEGTCDWWIFPHEMGGIRP